jgi:hypothetical protein
MHTTTLDQRVEVLRWPADAAERARLAALGRPRLLVLDDGAAPPLVWDDLEDWARVSDPPADRAARCRDLRQAAALGGAAPTPGIVVTAEGEVHAPSGIATVSPAGAAVLVVLVQRFGHAVDALALEWPARPHLATDAGLADVLAELRTALRPLGLRLERVGDAAILFHA